MSYVEQVHSNLKNGLKVYPIPFNSMFKIQVDYRGNIKTYDRLLKSKDVNSAIMKTHIHYYNKFSQTKQEIK